MTDIIKIQMRKIGFDQYGKKGIELADKEYGVLRWLQDLYDRNCLEGNFYTQDIVKEVWDCVLQGSNPLNKIDEAYDDMIRQAIELGRRYKE